MQKRKVARKYYTPQQSRYICSKPKYYFLDARAYRGLNKADLDTGTFFYSLYAEHYIVIRNFSFLFSFNGNVSAL